MSINLNSIIEYLSLLTPVDQSDDDLLTEDEQEIGALVSPWINYTLESNGYPDGNFLIRLRYHTENNLFQVQFWGRDFYNEWIGTNKHIFVSLLTNRINNKLNLGSWWLDLDDGSIAVVSSLIVSENGIDVESIQANINGLIRTLQQYYPILVRYVKSDGEPEDYNNALEALENLK